MPTPDRPVLIVLEPVVPHIPGRPATYEEAKARAVAVLHMLAAKNGKALDPASIRDEETIHGAAKVTAHYLSPEALERSA